MEFTEVVRKRRTIRDFSQEKVSPEIIEKALEAGLKAPSYNHLKEWNFVLVKDINTRFALTQTEKMIEEATDELKQTLQGYEALVKQMYMDAVPKQKKMILSAPELLVVVYKPKTQVSVSERVYDLNCLASVWCCIENILLSLADSEVYGVTFIPQNTFAIKKILNVPEPLEVAAIIPFGYRVADSKIYPQKEVKLVERLHTDTW
ncbi:nitroreductase family protein [Fusibacter sp. 3D3]|uniref:nitroreductase family protein n=1 Tax=Fusibacter sp. 3D3 TaxID=1048380 RepID=UPI000853D058|nr:nitroreductase family protein [Fusibacter sp. 3D3]GAU80012.1 nitroreductase family protein [Fusibacter sp. 3D3]